MILKTFFFGWSITLSRVTSAKNDNKNGRDPRRSNFRVVDAISKIVFGTICY